MSEGGQGGIPRACQQNLHGRADDAVNSLEEEEGVGFRSERGEEGKEGKKEGATTMVVSLAAIRSAGTAENRTAIIANAAGIAYRRNFGIRYPQIIRAVVIIKDF